MVLMRNPHHAYNPCMTARQLQRGYVWRVQTHADYEHRLQEEVNARLLKEQELQHLVQLPSFFCQCSRELSFA